MHIMSFWIWNRKSGFKTIKQTLDTAQNYCGWEILVGEMREDKMEWVKWQ